MKIKLLEAKYPWGFAWNNGKLDTNVMLEAKLHGEDYLIVISGSELIRAGASIKDFAPKDAYAFHYSEYIEE
jgi:hypothetical protein